MIDLIEEIEKSLENTRKLYEQVYENTLVKSYYHGVIVAYEGVLKSLEDKSIITAPKEIKLSEIVEKLKNDCGYGDVEIKRYSTYTAVWGIEYNLYLSADSLFDFNLKGEITIHNDCIYNWLYTLWIAGTTIIDDLEENVWITLEK